MNGREMALMLWGSRDRRRDKPMPHGAATHYKRGWAMQDDMMARTKIIIKNGRIVRSTTKS